MRRFEQSLPMALLRAREIAMGYFRPLLNAHGLTEQQWRVIRVLQEYGELEFNELSRIALIQPPSLTGILTRLGKLSLVGRRRSATDQRRLHVSLTPDGLRRYAKVSVESERRYGEIEQQFGKARLDSLMTSLREFDRLHTPAAATDPRVSTDTAAKPPRAAQRRRVSGPRPRARSRR